MSRRPEYMTSQDIHVGPVMTSKLLPSGSFVQPIEHWYVPKHVLEREFLTVKMYERFMTNKTFVYCRYGIHLIENTSFYKVTF